MSEWLIIAAMAAFLLLAVFGCLAAVAVFDPDDDSHPEGPE